MKETFSGGREVGREVTSGFSMFASGFSRFTSGFSGHFASLVPSKKGLLRIVGHFTSLVVSKKSFATPRDGLTGHFALLVISKKVPATNGDFDFFFSKTPDFDRLPIRNLNQNSHFFET